MQSLGEGLAPALAESTRGYTFNGEDYLWLG